MEKAIKLKFEKNHSPRKAGEIAVFTTREEKQMAQWYLANGIAVEVSEKEAKKSGCAECDKKHEAEVAVLKERISELEAELSELKNDEKDSLKAPEAIEKINAMTTVEEVNAFIEGEERKGVLKAAKERISELEKA